MELIQYSKNVSFFNSSEQVEASSNCSWLDNTLYFCLPVRPAQAVLYLCPKSIAIDFAVKPVTVVIFWNSLHCPSGVIAKWQPGAQTGTQTWTLQPDQQAVKVISAPKSLNKLCSLNSIYVCWRWPALSCSYPYPTDWLAHCFAEQSSTYWCAFVVLVSTVLDWKQH